MLNSYSFVGDLLIDLERAAASSPSKPHPPSYSNHSNGLLTTTPANNNKNFLAPPSVEPSFLYSPDKDIITGLPLVRTPSPGPLSPRVRPASALSNHEQGEVQQAPTFSVNDSNDDFKFQSYHLDYKYTPPPIKGPCCVCGDGIMGAVSQSSIYLKNYVN